jgi:hypothetical protein
MVCPRTPMSATPFCPASRHFRTQIRRAGGRHPRYGPNGVIPLNGIELTAEQQMPWYDAWGTSQTYPHYSIGSAWALDRPYKWTKQIPSFFGVTPIGRSDSAFFESSAAGHRILDQVVDAVESDLVDRFFYFEGARRRILFHLKLPRFRGHPNFGVFGVHNGKKAPALYAGLRGSPASSISVHPPTSRGTVGASSWTIAITS